MKTLFTFLIIILVSSFTPAQNYKQVKIYINDKDDIARLYEAGLQFDHYLFTKDNAIKVFISDEEFGLLKNTPFNYEILIDDWKKFYSELPKLTESEKRDFINRSKDQFNVGGFGFGSMGGFYTLDEVYAELDTMFMLYPDIITQRYQVGTSIEGRAIYAVKISDNPTISEDEPQAHFNALIHAREPQGMMTVLYYMYYLLENYGTDPEVTYLVNNREIYFVPVINVDGYEYNRITDPNGGGMWRKNRRNNGGSYGVDLNRNFGYQWGYDNIGSSPYPSDETYRGTAPFSEPETQAIRDLCESNNFKTTFNYHTYGNLLLYSWGYINQVTPDNDIFEDYCSDMSQYNGYVYGNSPSVLYEVNGSSDDWMYGEQTTKEKIIAITPEVGDWFWPSQSEIFPLAQENLQPNLYLTWASGEFVYPGNFNFDHEYFNPGDVVNVTIEPVYNKGLSDASDISIELSSASPLITITSSSINVGSIPARSQVNPTDPLSFSISPSAPADQSIQLVFSIFSGTDLMRSDTIQIITGTPVFAFADTTNDPTVLWTITATPANPHWEATNFSYYSAPNSYTDSKNGDYSNNATVTMTLTNPVDLTSYNNPKLSFWTKYDIENNWDYGQVQVSTNNGATWTAVEGIYTNPGTGSFQPNGEPLYDGVQNDWVKEEIDLAPFISDQFKVRFRLRSDGFVTRDGWYVDDISVYVYSIIPVELNSFTANYKQNSVLLNWTTASETNNSGFEVQRKYSSVGSQESEWETIKFIPGFGTTTEPRSYSYSDDLSAFAGISQTIYYRLKQIDYDGTFSYSEVVQVDIPVVTDYSLEQNYPNPFNPETKIVYSIPEEEYVSLKVYNILGSEVANLVNKKQQAGRYEVVFSSEPSGKNIGSGVYFYTLKAGSFTATRKMVVIK
ncbi:MAG: hypothetical protein Kow0098_02650 [Ignavibacteriaceae bacterium]